ncbi:unnamed protein product [Discosporangium mesarthrocarpum]
MPISHGALEGPGTRSVSLSGLRRLLVVIHLIPNMLVVLAQEEKVSLRVDSPRMCTVEELLPFRGKGQWFDTTETTPSFNCTCPYYKARYYCPHAQEFRKIWEPYVVRRGTCSAIDRDSLVVNPLPPYASVLFVGNSHMRQIVESILCLATESIREREVMLFLGDNKPQRRHPVAVSRQCRGGWLARGCEAKLGPTSQCNDDMVTIVFENHATLRYAFENREGNKSIEKYAALFGMKPSDFDAVITNKGNAPPMTQDALVASARALNAAGVPLFWLTTFEEGVNWEIEQSPFKGIDVVPFDTKNMVSGQRDLKVGIVEKDRSGDPHFCLPGPPSEIGILVLRMVWARINSMSVL